MSEIIGASLELNSDQAKQAVGSFKKELRDAEQDLLKISDRFGSISPQAVEAAKKVAQMRDRIGEMKSLTDAFNPDAKFRAFSNTIAGIGGGFASVTGLMGLLGSKSEETEKLLLKINSALAFSQGLSQLGELKESFQQLGTFIKSTTAFQWLNNAATKAASVTQKLFAGSVNTTALSFKVLKTAIAATGIGLLIIGITELLPIITNWISGTDDAEAAQNRLKRSVDAVNQSLANNLNAISLNTKKTELLLKKAGATEAELFENRKKGIAKEVTELNDAYNKKADLYNKELAAGIVSNEKLAELRDDAQKTKKERDSKFQESIIANLEFEADMAEKGRQKTKEQGKKAIGEVKKALHEAETELRKLKEENFLSSISDENKREEERIKIEAANERKRFEAIKVTTAKESEIKKQLLIETDKKEQIALTALAEKNRKEAEEREKQGSEILRKIKNENALLSLSDEEERKKLKIEQDYQDTITELTALQISEDQKTEILKEAKISRDAALKSVDDVLKLKQDEIKLELDNQALNDFDLKNQQLDQWYKGRYAIVKGNLELEAQLTKEYEQQKTDIRKAEQLMQLSIIGDTLGQAANLFGKATVASKVLALAQIASGTAVAFIQGLDIAQKGAKGTGPAAPFAFPIFYATQVIAILGAVAKAKAALGASGTGGGSVPSVSAPSIAPPAPLSPAQTSSGVIPTDQGNAAAGGVNRSFKTYVLSGDVQREAELEVRLNRAARLGG